MNLGIESEKIEFKKSTSELIEGVISISAMLNKHGEGMVYFGVKLVELFIPFDINVISRD